MKIGSENCEINFINKFGASKPLKFTFYWFLLEHELLINVVNRMFEQCKNFFLPFLGLRKHSILWSTYRVTRFLFLTLFSATFCDFVQNQEFRATFETVLIFSQKVAKLHGSSGMTIRTIILAVRARKSKNFS